MGRQPDVPSADLTPQTFQILLSLAQEPLHGYGIMSDVLERTDGRMKLWPGALYGALKKLTDAGLAEETDPPAGAPQDRMERRFYRITRAGRAALKAEAARMAAYVAAVKART